MEFYTKAFFVGVAILVGYLLLLVLQPFAGSMAWAIFLAFILNPFHVWVTRKLGNRPTVSAGIITGLTPFALLTPITLLGFAFAEQARTLIQFLRGRNLQLDGSILLQLEQYPVIGPAAHWAREQLAMSAIDIQDWITKGTEALMRNVGSLGSGIVLSAVGTVVGFFFMLFLLFFILRDGQSMFIRLKRLIPVPEEHREQLFNHLASVARGVFYGIGLTAIVQGILVGVGFTIAQLPSPVVFGVLAAILGLLPAGGAAIVWVPAVLYLAGVGRWKMATFLFIWGVITSTSDNFLRPLLVSRYARCRPSRCSSVWSEALVRSAPSASWWDRCFWRWWPRSCSTSMRR